MRTCAGCKTTYDDTYTGGLCPGCGENAPYGEEPFLLGEDEIKMRSELDGRYVPCGSNADWSVSAWHLGPGPEPNRTSGDFYVLDIEDDEGGYMVVRRWYIDDGYDDPDGPGNDWIEDVAEAALAMVPDGSQATVFTRWHDVAMVPDGSQATVFTRWHDVANLLTFVLNEPSKEPPTRWDP